MIHKNPRKVPDSVVRNLDAYLEKSKDDKDVFLNFGIPNREVWTFEDSWIDFVVMGKCFTVISINIIHAPIIVY